MSRHTHVVITAPPPEPPRPDELRVAYLRRRGLRADRAALIAALAFGMPTAEVGKAGQ